MTFVTLPKQDDFVEPIHGWRIWRRTTKRYLRSSWLGGASALDDEPANDDELTATAPDYVEPVIGWRIWRAVKCDGQYVLASLFNNIVWVPGKSLDARCLSLISVAQHRSPDPKCHCGVYAARRESIDWRRLGHRGLTPLVVGRVSLWGPVVEGEHGWRAEHGYPERLFVPRVGKTLKERDQRVAESLEAYGVPTRTILVDNRRALMPVLEALCQNAAEPAPIA